MIANQDAASATSQRTYSLLVVLNDKDEHLNEEYYSLIEAACIDMAVVSTLFLQASLLNKVLQEGHLFYSVVCKEENLLYDNGIPLPQMEQKPVSEIIDAARKQFMDVSGRADSFLDGANHYYRQNENELSAFL